MYRLNTKRFDRLSPEARRKAERNSEIKAFNGATAMTEALQRAQAARQASTPPTANEAHHGPHTTADTP